MWGNTYRDKNLFQEYFLEIVEQSNSEDRDGLQELFDELSPEQQMDIWSRLASYTRSTIKSLGVQLKAL